MQTLSFVDEVLGCLRVQYDSNILSCVCLFLFWMATLKGWGEMNVVLERDERRLSLLKGICGIAFSDGTMV